MLSAICWKCGYDIKADPENVAKAYKWYLGSQDDTDVRAYRCKDKGTHEPGLQLVNTHSHRARHRLEQLLGQSPQEFYVWGSESHYCWVPESKVEESLKIKGISKGKPKGRLAKCW